MPETSRFYEVGASSREGAAGKAEEGYSGIDPKEPERLSHPGAFGGFQENAD